MKKFTFLLAGLFLTVAAYSQTPAETAVITKVWDKSIQGEAVYNAEEDEWTLAPAPAWMGATTERGMTVLGDRVYIPSRKDGNKIIVLDAATGLQIEGETITYDEEVVKGGTFVVNSIATTHDGKLIITNLTTNTKSRVRLESDGEAPAPATGAPNGHFKAYVLDPATKVATPLLAWTNLPEVYDEAGDAAVEALTRIGDGMHYFGTVAEGYVLAPVSSSNKVIRFNIVNGALAGEPLIVALGDNNLGAGPQVWAIDNNMFVVDGKDLFPIVFTFDGTQVGTFPVDLTPKQGNGNGAAYFMFKDRHFMLANTTIWNTKPNNAFELFEMTNLTPEIAGVSVGVIPALGMGGASNSSFTYPVALDIQADAVLMYMMTPSNGIACYKLTLGTVGINSANANSVTVYPSPATDKVNFSATMSVVEVYNATGQLVKSAKNVDQLNVAELQGLYIVKGVDVQGNALVQKLIIK